MIMENSSALAFSGDIENNINMGSCEIDFPFSPALPLCSVFGLPPPPSPLSDHTLNDASFSGYMDDFNNSWFLDYNFETGTSESLPVAIQTDVQLPPLPVLSPIATSDVLNNPATPVSDSPLNNSSSNEAGAVANKPVVAVAEHEDGVEFVGGKKAGAEAEDRDGDRRIEVVENPNDQNQTKKPVKPKKKYNYKPKQRPTKVTFKTETEVDHLDDGFKWRKYGQKRVKNSPFPRSYYRCTTPGCGVKKHIERCAPEPWMLLISYEGNHNHQAPKVTRPARPEIMHDPIAAGVQKIYHNQIKTNGVDVAGNQFTMSQPQPQQIQIQTQNVIIQKPALPPLSYNNNNNNNNSFNIAPTMNVNSADNSPPLNVVNSANKFFRSSTTFSEFLQNLGGCNFSMSTDNLMNNNGFLPDMIKPMDMRGAADGAGAGAGAVA